jgi:hypothetical protein
VAQLEPLGDRLIARQVRLVEIIQQATPLPDHDQEAAPGTMVLDILLQMFGQMIDALGQKSDLHVSGPCVALVQPEPCYRLSFFHILFDQYSLNLKFKIDSPSCKVLSTDFLPLPIMSFFGRGEQPAKRACPPRSNCKTDIKFTV